MKKDIYKDTLEFLGGGRISEEEMKRYCQYKSRTADRYCAATCQTTCKKCRFFEPTSHAKVDIMTRVFNSEKIGEQIARIKELKQYVCIGKAVTRHMNKRKPGRRNLSDF